MVTGSKRAMAVATSAKATCAGCAPCRQLSGRSGQSIQQPACGANSAGIANPSLSGVELSVRAMVGPHLTGPSTQGNGAVVLGSRPLRSLEKALQDVYPDESQGHPACRRCKNFHPEWQALRSGSA